MARQSVDIGVEGNDGTGDSIRESFRKVNENFRELYAVFGKGGQIGFVDLSDTPSTLVSNAGKIPAVNPGETALAFYELVSDAGDNDPLNPLNSISFEYQGNKLKVTAVNTKLGQDSSPTLSAPLNASQVIAYDNTTNAILRNTSTGLDIDDLASSWNTSHPTMPAINSNNVVISKGYADDKYLKLAGDTMVGNLTLAGDPTSNLHAATKNYVDTNSFSSTVNYFVSTSGRTKAAMISDGVPTAKIGRGLSYAFNSLVEACYAAEETVFNSTLELGPYAQPITVNSGASLSTTDTTPTVASGSNTRLRISNNSGTHVDQGDPTNRDLIPGKLVVGATSTARGFITSYVGTSGSVDLIDLEMVTDATIATISRAANIATIVTASEHGYTTGDRVVINCSTNTFDNFAGVVITVINPTTFRYANSGTDVTAVAATGTVAKSFAASENIYFDNSTPTAQITIFVESGEYFEDFPIRVPANTSIVGDELRRTVIRPIDRVSQSPWAAVHFYRNTTIDDLTVVSQNYGYHYLSNPAVVSSTPKNNKDIDTFMMNDATSLVHLTIAGHGGFAVVLDPEGQIKTKSPYVQGCSSITASVNKKSFRGGMFIDGFVSRMQATLTATYSGVTQIVVTGSSAKKVRPFTTVTSIIPNMPSSFFIRGVRYQINNIESISGGTNATPTPTLTLNLAGSFSGTTGDVITLETAGNKSALATHFTQINDLGYGCVAINNALLELVSIFTYYCHTAYYSYSGGQIRSVNGSNSNGFFGLKAEGSDPLEVPRVGKLTDNLIQIARIYKKGQYSTSTYNSQDSTSVVIYGFDFVPYNITEFEINHPIAGRTAYIAPNATPIKNTVSISSISRSTNTVTVVTGINHGFTNGQSVIIANVTGGTTSFNGTFTITYVDPTTFTYAQTGSNESGTGGSATLNVSLVRLNMGTGISNTGTSLFEDLTDGDYVVLRSNQNFRFSGDFSSISTRPSTAIEFSNDGDDRSYRSISLVTTYYDPTKTPSDVGYGVSESILPDNIIGIDNNFNYVSLTPVAQANGGDTTIVIANLAASDASRVVGYEFGWVDQNVSQKGFKRVITNYSANTPIAGQATITLDTALPTNTFIDIADTLNAGIRAAQSTTLAVQITAGSTPTTITLTDSDNFSTTGILQIGNEYFSYTGNNRSTNVLSGVLRAQNGSIAELHNIGATVEEVSALITTNISTTRATGHDFLNIGTGGYNTSNFPNNIYGESTEAKVESGSAIDSNGTNSKAEVQEKLKGRVFFTGTNQDGFFRVGRFFTVDQGTGTVSFNASIVLSNIDGLGFKRGITISEFSNDSSMPDLGDAVPTSSAVRGYVSRRLGFNDTGIADSNPIGPGAVARDGSLALTGDLSMGGFKLQNVATPATGTDAANKSYVDNAVATKDTLAELSDVTLTTPASANLLAFTGTGTNSVNASVSGDVVFTLSAGVLTSAISTGAVVNADVSASAAIAQSKLSMNAATTRANATGITQGDLGLASFSSAEFDATGGWVSLSAGGIANNKLANSSITIGSSGVSLGGTITVIAGLTSVSATTFTGNLTGNVTGTVSSTTNVDVRARNTTDAVHYITFAEAVSGAQRINTDTGITYNPGTNQMSILGSILPGANNPTDSGQNIGSGTNKWNTVYATVFNGTATQAQYADLAENYLGDTQYEPGTVLVFGGDQEVTVTNQKSDRRVAGIVTTDPAYLMNSMLVGDHVVGLALQGRVPCKVLGKVNKGDILVTSAIPGYAIVDNDPRVGTVVGKAVGAKLDDSRGYVEVVVGRF
jgi:hypothetical protein